MLSNNLRIEKNCAKISFSKEVTTESICELVETFDVATSYYKCRKLILEIDSKGGQVSALNLFVERLKKFREQGILLETNAVSSVASAAAVMLTLGDIGHRSAEKHAKILFHNSRVNGNMQLTSIQASRLQKELQDVDSHIFDEVINHNLPAIEKRFDDTGKLPESGFKLGLNKVTSTRVNNLEKFTNLVIKKYRALFEVDDFMSAQQTADMCLIDYVR